MTTPVAVTLAMTLASAVTTLVQWRWQRLWQ
jgi:hypothetical protein